MEFSLKIDLDDEKVAEEGIDRILPVMLLQAYDRVISGSADAGVIMDENGNTVGFYRTTDISDEAGMWMCAYCDTGPWHRERNECPTCETPKSYGSHR